MLDQFESSCTSTFRLHDPEHAGCFFFPELCHLFLGLGYVDFPHQFTAGSQELQHTRMLGFEVGNNLLPITRCQKRKRQPLYVCANHVL
jgi:hypothetical protein